MHNQATKPIKISFVGGGNMARALIAGLRSGTGQASDIHVVDIMPESLLQLNTQFGVTTSTQMDAQITESDVVILSVKPQHAREVAEQLIPWLKQQLIISIVSGIRAADLSRWLRNHSAIVRTMPNMPALINLGVTGMYAASQVSAPQRAIADTILRAVGKTVWLDNETLLDALTAISGSGPAYVFYFIEAMQKAAVEMGLSQEQGKELALATFTGASQLAAQSNESATELRARVTSKGGTTQAAIGCMEQRGVTDAIISAAKAAAERAREMGNEFGSQL